MLPIIVGMVCGFGFTTSCKYAEMMLPGNKTNYTTTRILMVPHHCPIYLMVIAGRGGIYYFQTNNKPIWEHVWENSSKHGESFGRLP